MKRTLRKALSLLLVALMLTSLLGLSALAKTDGPVSAETVTGYILGKDGQTKNQILQWTADHDGDTYKDSNGIEMPGIVDVGTTGYDNFGDGDSQGYILYTGSDNGSFVRNIIVTKYVEVESLATQIAEEAGLTYDSNSWYISMLAGDNWSTSYGPYEAPNLAAGGQITASYPLYSSFDWLYDCFVNGNSSNGVVFAPEAYSDAHTVPAILGLCNWNVRVNALSGDSGVILTDADSLKAAFDAISAKTDMANALRLVSGMDPGVSGGKYLNTGANSEKGVADIILQPVYNAIAITDGVADGTEGVDGFSYAVQNAVITSADDWFKAANGETVFLTVAADEGFAVTAVEVTGAAVTDIGNGNYSFTMPNQAVAVTVTTGEATSDPIHTGDPDSPVWDGTLDFRWYDENNVQAEYHITTPAQWAALAWICSEESANQKNLTGLREDFSEYTNGNVIDIYGDIPANQQVFEGVQFYLDNDIDMGGVYDSNTNTWSGPNYYPVGSQAMNDLGIKDGISNAGSSGMNLNKYCFYGLFYGSFDGQNNVVYNIYCDRGSGQDWQSAGLFGRTGSADGVSPQPACNIVIENVAVTGFIRAGRSVGGIVGKTLHVAAGYTTTVRNCLNFADIRSSDSKGTAGVVGAGWNTPIYIDNCANFGTVIASYQNGGGISGSFEGISNNCYNVGDISQSAVNHGQAFGTSNGGGARVYNFYWREGTSNTAAPNDAVFGGNAANTTYKITDNYNGSGLTAIEYMKTADFLDDLNLNGENWAFAQASDPIYGLMSSMGFAGLPVPVGFATKIDIPDPSDPTKWDGSIDTSWYNTTDMEFTLTTAAQFAGFAAIVNNKPENSSAGLVTGINASIPADDFEGKTVFLAADLDLGGMEVSPGSLIGTTYTQPVWSGLAWTPIGSYTSSDNGFSFNGVTGRPFKGIFDGGFHDISNIYIPGGLGSGDNDNVDNSHGLFGDLGLDGIVKNVIIKSGYIYGDRFTGGIVGRNWGTIESCGNYATIESDGQRNGGGIAGVNYKNNTPYPTIRNCFNAGLVIMRFNDSGYRPGGIVSDNEGIVENCYNIGRGINVRNNNNMAGIVGGSRAATAPINSYSLAGDGMPTTISAATIPAGCAILPAAQSGYELASPVWSDGATDYTSGQIAAMAFTESAKFTARAIRLSYNVIYDDALITILTGVTDGKATYGTPVTFEWSGSSAATGYTLYVSYKIGDGEEVELTATAGVYTIPGNAITGDVTITAYLVVEGSVTFIDFNNYRGAPTGYKVALLRPSQGFDLPDGYAYYIFGTGLMFWSAKYEAYVWFVDENMDASEVLKAITLGTGEAAAVAYDGDVNRNGEINNFDAEAVVELYRGVWLDDFTVYSMLNRLEADVNGDGTVDLTDVRAIWVIIID